MAEGGRTVARPVRDLGQAGTASSALLESDPVVDTPYYVQFDA